jgi:hypothetical protein
MGARWIKFTPTFLRPLIKCVNICSWIKCRLMLSHPVVSGWGSYFSGRIQRVRMGDCVSRDILVTSGVSQGSHLRPLCFIWVVNEISRIFGHVRVLFYADDMKLFLLVRGFQDCLKIQSDLNRLAEWCEANALELNVGNCKSITFSRLSIDLCAMERPPYTTTGVFKLRALRVFSLQSAVCVIPMNFRTC